MKKQEQKFQFADEHELQRCVVKRLRSLGYIVDVSSSNVRGRRQHRGSADFKVTHATWDRGIWRHFETKNPNTRGRLSAEQFALALVTKRVILVWSWNDVAVELGLPLDMQMFHQLD